jgi:hypothetical protein
MFRIGEAIQVFICVAGLLLVVLDIILLKSKARVRWSVSVVVAVLLLVTGSFLIGRLRSFQCAYTVPDQIKVAGHVKGNSGTYLNNYLVLLYRGNDEVDRATTIKGKFNDDRNDKENDGYFELEIPNTDLLTRCSMIKNFRQDSSAYSFLSPVNHTTYLWHNFTDLGTGVSLRINKSEGKKIYTLVVLSDSLDDFPEEIKHYPTYLDQTGRIVINVPIKLYRLMGDSAVEMPTEYFVKDSSTMNILQGVSDPAEGDVQDAWVMEDSTHESLSPAIADDEIIDINNCGQTSSRNETIKARIIYYHEVQFMEDGNSLSNDLGTIALRATDSLGFTQGQIDTKEAAENVDVPAGARMKYIYFWQEQWNNGKIVTNVDQNMIPLYFRVRNDMHGYFTSYPVDCP